MASVEDLKAEKAKLEKRLSDIQVELSKHGEESSNGTTSKYSSTTGKASYLYKWQDRAIGWGGTKWGLRYVVLKGGVLSYFKDRDDAIRHAPRYKITLKNCAIRDDGYKENRHKKGSFFHVFSIYQRPKGKQTHFAEEDDADDIIPLLRFSPGNLAEKNQWMELLAEACAYCDSNEYVEEKEDTTAPVLLSGVQHKKGTLPPLIFAPVAPTARLKRVNSSHVKLNKSKDAAKSNRGDYPPSKPMHRTVDPSYLSSEAHVQNYRGILNLFIIILIISNIRLLKETIRQYGFVISHGYFMKDGDDDFDWNDIDFPLILGLLMLNVFVVLTYFIELSLAKKRLPEWFGMTLHFFNINLGLGISSYVVYDQLDSPINGAVLMLCATVLWMKLISFVHANSDYRHHPERNQDTNIGFVTSVDEDSLTRSYPQNVTLSNLYYFWFAPTLTYQIAFPRLAARNFPRIFSLAIRLFICNLLAVFLIAQIIKPVLSDLINALEADSTLSVYSVHIFAEYILKLGMTSTYIWLLIFYGFFHVFLNLLAELLRFGDRVFYRDWWNSSNVSSYWRLWNLPVHYWLVRHLYFPCIRFGFSKSVAMFIVFLFSAILHEVVIAVPFHIFHIMKPYAFMGMMAQIPLVAITKYIDKVMPGSSLGNIIFWMSFCIIGQPSAVMMYAVDYWRENTASSLETSIPPECRSFLWIKTCHHEL